jgi:hypothetical protein
MHCGNEYGNNGVMMLRRIHGGLLVRNKGQQGFYKANW